MLSKKCFALFCALFFVPLMAGAERPNILFIIADDLNDFVGVMNHGSGVRTPNIDRLAENAAVFTNAHANAPVCAPSRASLFSGIYPHVSGQYLFTHWRKNEMLANSYMLMEKLGGAGYHTAGVGKLLHHGAPLLWGEFGSRGFDYSPLAYDGERSVAHPQVPVPYGERIIPIEGTFIRLSRVPKTKGAKGWWYEGSKERFDYVDEGDRSLLPDEQYAGWAVARIEEWGRKPLGKPFFLAVGFVRPHAPLVVPDEYFDMFPLGGITVPPQGEGEGRYFEEVWKPRAMSKGRVYYEMLLQSFGGDRSKALKAYYQAYLASIAFMDAQLGRVLDALEGSPYRDNTIIVFTSDHGYHLGERGYLYKNNLWERSTRVPLIIYDPRNKKQKRIGEAVSLVDLYPSFLEMAGVKGRIRKNEKGGVLSGESLVPLIRGGWWKKRGRVALTALKRVREDSPPSFALRTKEWRYILYGTGGEELYHHPSDPKEERNLVGVGEYRGVHKKLRRKLLSITTK
ncbi:MAG: sulfatase [Parvibaculales bacterium]